MEATWSFTWIELTRLLYCFWSKTFANLFAPLPLVEGQAERGTLFTTIKLLSRNFMCPVIHRHTRFFYVTRDDKTLVPELQALSQLLADGKIDVKTRAVFDLEVIQEAHNSWGKSAGFGSVLINVGAK